MSRRPFWPDPFAIGLIVFGAVLMVFPAMRIAAIVAVSLGLIYWLLMAVLKSLRR